MKQLNRILFVAALLLNASLTWAQNYKIEGTAEGIANGTWLYLKPASDLPLDSVQVQNNKFSFKGQLTENPSNAVLYTAKYVNYVFFWLENKVISMAVKNGEFKKGSIKGSATEDENNQLSSKIQPLREKEEELIKAVKGLSDQEEINRKRKQIDSLEAAEATVYKEYVKTHPNSIVSANLLNIYCATWGKPTTNELYQGLSATMKQSKFGQQIADFIKYNQAIKVGSRFVDFEQLNGKGQKVKLSQVKGKYVLLEFWGSWCGPCREENPNLVKTYNAYKGKGFEILGVAADNNKEQWLKAIKDDGLPWENVSDLKGDKNIAALIYGINAYPTNFLIDEKGIIIAKNLRGDKLREKLEELLP